MQKAYKEKRKDNDQTKYYKAKTSQMPLRSFSVCHLLLGMGGTHPSVWFVYLVKTQLEKTPFSFLSSYQLHTAFELGGDGDLYALLLSAPGPHHA